MNICEEINLDERKAIMLNMLEALLKYCEIHDIRVFLCGGTLLGAVRHKGYIPWDDDIDVMMPMEDYDRFMDLIEKEPLSEPFRISTPKNNDSHMWPFLKMVDYRTVLTEPVVTKRLRKRQESFYGIYIDIFPMYGLPDDPDERRNFQENMCRLYSKYKKASRVMNRRPKDSTVLYAVRYVLYEIYCLPNRMIGLKHYLNAMDKLKRQYPISNSIKMGFASGITSGEKDHVETRFLNENTLLRFECIDCPVLSNYHAMLENQYGNYMVLPPEGQRHIHPSNVKWR